MGILGLPVALLLALSMAVALIGGIGRNYYCKLLVRDRRGYHLLNGTTGAVCALLLWAMDGFGRLTAAPFTLWLGVVFGLVSMTQGLANSAALRVGPWSYTQVLVSLATIIPALSGALFWGERIGLLQLVGMVLLVACFVLSVDSRHTADSRRASLRWLALCAVAFLCTGAIGVMQKVHQTSAYKQELSGFLIVAFLVAAVVSAALCCLPAPPAAAADGSRRGGVSRLGVAALFLVIGASTAFINQVNLYLSGVMPSAVFFPLVNGGGLVLSTLASITLFRERLSRRQWLGLALGTLAVLLLCL